LRAGGLRHRRSPFALAVVGTPGFARSLHGLTPARSVPLRCLGLRAVRLARLGPLTRASFRATEFRLPGSGRISCPRGPLFVDGFAVCGLAPVSFVLFALFLTARFRGGGRPKRLALRCRAPLEVLGREEIGTLLAAPLLSPSSRTLALTPVLASCAIPGVTSQRTTLPPPFGRALVSEAFRADPREFTRQSIGLAGRGGAFGAALRPDAFQAGLATDARRFELRLELQSLAARFFSPPLVAQSLALLLLAADERFVSALLLALTLPLELTLRKRHASCLRPHAEQAGLPGPADCRCSRGPHDGRD
jgi:hypothetical protein